MSLEAILGLLILVGIAGGVLLIPLLMRIRARMSGWLDLSRVYAAPESHSCEVVTAGYLRLRSENYGKLALVGGDESGLYLRTHRKFRASHRPLLIPWDEVSGVVTEPKLGIYTELTPSVYVQLTFRQAPSVPCLVKEDLAQKLEQASGSAWQYQRSG